MTLTDHQKKLLARISEQVTQMLRLDCDSAFDWVAKLTDLGKNPVSDEQLLKHVWQAEHTVDRAKGRAQAQAYIAESTTEQGRTLLNAMARVPLGAFSSAAAVEAFTSTLRAHYAEQKGKALLVDGGDRW